MSDIEPDGVAPGEGATGGVPATGQPSDAGTTPGVGALPAAGAAAGWLTPPSGGTGAAGILGGAGQVAAADGVVDKASAGLHAASAAPIGSGVATGTGLAADAIDAGNAASQGDAAGATDAVVRATATGAAAYFGGTAGGDTARRVLESAPGRLGTRAVSYVTWGAVAAVLVPLLLVGSMIAGMFSVVGGTSTAVAAACTGGGSTYDGGSGGIWAMKYLYDKGFRGEILHVMWAIVMRESSGNPAARAPAEGTYNNGTFDAGVFQTNSQHTATLATYGFTMEDMFDPDKSLTYWVSAASPNGKLMSDLSAWGHFSWSDTSLNTANYQDWSAQMHQELIVIPFQEKYAMFDDAARQAGIVPGPTESSSVSVPAAGSHPAQVLTPDGAATARSAVAAAKNGDKRSVTPRRATSPEEPGSGAVPPDQMTVSGHEALKEGDSRLVTFTVAGRSVTVSAEYEQLFTDFLAAWDQDPTLGQGRLNISKGIGPVDSYEYRKARESEKWSDHAGYAVDIRYDILKAPDGSGAKYMTSAEEEATRALLRRFPALGWGGDYQPASRDEMHFYVAAGAAGQPVDAGACGNTTAIGVNPGSSVLPYEDKVLPAPGMGWTVNYPHPGYRNMVYYSQGDDRWPAAESYNFASCGCGHTSMAMLISTLGNVSNYTPVDAYLRQKALGGIWQGCGTVGSTVIFPKMASEFGIPGRAIGTDWEAARNTLRRGGLVVASMSVGIFTDSAHYIVIRGITQDGRFLVADPNPAHYDLMLSQSFSTSDFNFNQGMIAFLPPGQTF